MSDTNIGISDHCVQQFLTKSRAKKSKDEARAKIQEMLSKSTPVALKSGYRANNILLNGFRGSKFRRFSDWLFVLDEECSVVITCYPSAGIKWIALTN